MSRATCGGDLSSDLLQLRRVVFDERDQTSDCARLSPPRARHQVVDIDLPRHCSRGNCEDERVALAAAAAERRCSDPAASPFQLVRQGQRKSRAAHANGVTQSDGATVGIDLLFGHPELVGRHDARPRRTLR